MTEFPTLHHVALTVTDLEASRAWYTRLLGGEAVLDELGIAHGGVAEDARGCALSFRDPDGIALELWAPRS